MGSIDIHIILKNTLTWDHRNLYHTNKNSDKGLTGIYIKLTNNVTWDVQNIYSFN